MQAKQQFARVAAGRLGGKTGHRTYGCAELLAARPFRLTTFPNDVRSGSGNCACQRNQQ